MDRYCEVENKLAPNDGLSNGVIAFDTLEEAIQFAEENNCELICEIGGSWDEFRKCWFCEEWLPTTEFNHGATVCERCEVAIRGHEYH